MEKVGPPETIRLKLGDEKSTGMIDLIDRSCEMRLRIDGEKEFSS